MSSEEINFYKIVTGAAVAATTIISTYLIYNGFFLSANDNGNQHQAKSKIDDKDHIGTIKQIWIFPIAGCRGFHLSESNESWNLVDGGLEFDREFCFVIPTSVEDNNKVMKKVSTLPIQNEIFTNIVVEDGNKPVLIVTYKNAPTQLRIPLASDKNKENSDSISFDLDRYGTLGKATDMGDGIAKWFQDFVFADMNHPNALSQDQESYKNNQLAQVRLARVSQLRKPVNKDSHKGSGATETDGVRFQAFGGLHLMTEESLSWLQQQLPEKTEEASTVPAVSVAAAAAGAGAEKEKNSSSTIKQKSPQDQNETKAMALTCERFRANLLIGGVPHPIEDRWRRVEIVGSSETSSSIPLHFAKHTDRCEVPTMNPVTGRRHPAMQPTATIKKVRGACHPHQLENFRVAKKAFDEANNKNDGKNEENDAVPLKEPLAKAMFGIEMFHEKNGKISVGDKILVKELAGKGLIFC